MANEISDIDSGGGGDYTTLAAWWAAKKNNAAGTVPHARCITPGDEVGLLDLSGGTFQTAVGEVVKIYAEDASGDPIYSDGDDPTVGVYIDADVSTSAAIENTTIAHLEIDGIGVSGAAPIARYFVRNAMTEADVDTANDCSLTVKNATVKLAGVANPIAGIRFEFIASTADTYTGSVTVENSLVVSDEYPVIVAGFTNSNIAATLTLTTAIRNCTLDGNSTATDVVRLSGLTYDDDALLTLTSTLENVLAVDGSTTDLYEDSGGTAGTVVHDTNVYNCLSSDATAASFSGYDNLTNKASADQFVSGTHFLKHGADAIAAGRDISTLTNDLIGNPHGTVWPNNQGGSSVWDIGALTKYPVVSDLHSDGSGDYSTGTLWDAAKAAGTNPFQWVACDDSGDSGAIRFSSSWAGGNCDASNFVCVYAKTEHGGVEGTGAYIVSAGGGFSSISTSDGSMNNLRVVGMTLRVGNVAHVGTTADGDDVLYDRILVYPDGVASMIHGILLNAFEETATTGTIRNSLVRTADQHVSSTGIGANLVLLSGANTKNLAIQNCTAYGCTRGMGGGAYGPDEITNVTLENCVAMNSGTADFVAVSGAGGVVNLTLNNCISEDGTADDFSGSGNLVDQDPDAVFNDAAGNDFTIPLTSPARDAGKDLSSSYTSDIAGNVRVA